MPLDQPKVSKVKQKIRGGIDRRSEISNGIMSANKIHLLQTLLYFELKKSTEPCYEEMSIGI